MIATWEGRQAIGSHFNLPTCLLDSASFKVLKADCFRDNPFFLHKIHFAPVDCAMQTYMCTLCTCTHGIRLSVHVASITYVIVPNTIDSLISRFSAQKIDKTKILQPNQN